ncbi:hypothetical protein [Pseudonocardia charpentierae]|uniref:Dioxygenase n=1 Tax=Pseudonocardia charpentierae TaxID=3075545 RepID=A0ABU2NN73_9PSEU|nr:hypothetical protein [Pseudonocardia sp. DSM 45834]MDT0354084.1 hypothetical protein [Pseudonocardia sp. DSM 45834]
MGAGPAPGSAREPDGLARDNRHGLQHEAYFYDDGEQYLTEVPRFVRGGLAGSEPVRACHDSRVSHG